VEAAVCSQIWTVGNGVIVSRPSPSTSWTLQQNGNLANTNGWSAFELGEILGLDIRAG
jgi:hypothetical protein